MEIIPHKHTWIRSYPFKKRKQLLSRMCEPRKLLRIFEWHNLYIFKTSFIAFSFVERVFWRKLNRKGAFQFEDLNEMIFAILWRIREKSKIIFFDLYEEDSFFSGGSGCRCDGNNKPFYFLMNPTSLGLHIVCFLSSTDYH